MRYGKLCCLIAGILSGLLSLSTPLKASVISMRTDASASTNNGRIELSVRLTNGGDEAAHAVRTEARLGKQQATHPARPTLNADESCETALDLGPLPDRDGQYIIVLKTHYTDANGYPFSALASLPLMVNNAGELEQPVLAALPPLSLSDRGTLNVKIKLLGSHPVDARIELVLPDELSCSDREQNILLEPNQNRVTTFHLENFSGRAGSTYAVLVLVTFLQDNIQYSMASSGVVSIAAPRPLFSKGLLIWGIIIGMLVLCGILAQFVPRKQL